MNKAKQIKKILVKLAMEDKLPMDMSELDESIFNKLFEENSSKVKQGIKAKICMKANLEVVGKVRIGDRTLSEKELYERIVNEIPSAQFSDIIQKIKKG